MFERILFESINTNTIMKNLALGIASILFLSCSSKSDQPSQVNANPFEVGQTYIYDYGDAKYELDCLTDSTLHWKCIEGEEKGKEETDKYKKQNLGNNSVFVTWIEADGIGVSQILNFTNGDVSSFLKIDKEIVLGNGKIAKKQK